jgi:hypothetical protein
MVPLISSKLLLLLTLLSSRSFLTAKSTPPCGSLALSFRWISKPSEVSKNSLLQTSSLSNSEHDHSWGSLGSPAVTSSPKPKPNTYQPTRNSKALRFLCINFQSARKKGKDISVLVESVQPDIIMGTET